MPSARATIGAHGGVREPRHEAREELAHRRLGQRLEVERREAALGGAPVGAALEQLRPREGDDEERRRRGSTRARWSTKSRSAGVGVMEVLEHEDDRCAAARAARRTSARRRTAARGPTPRLDPQQREHRGLEPAALLRRRGSCAASGRRDPGAGRRLVVALEQAAARADHLAERPEADPVAVGRGCGRRATRPARRARRRTCRNSHASRDLPMPAGPEHRDEARPALPGGRVVQVLQQPQLVVAADERRPRASRRGCGRRARPRPAARRHAGTGAALPLSACSPAGSKAIARRAARWVASPTSTVPGGAADWSRARRVHEVARDHALVRRADRDGGLARQHAGPRLDARPEGADRVDQLEAGPDGALGVVLVGGRARPRRPSRRRR